MMEREALESDGEGGEGDAAALGVGAEGAQGQGEVMERFKALRTRVSEEGKEAMNQALPRHIMLLSHLLERHEMFQMAEEDAASREDSLTLRPVAQALAEAEAAGEGAAPPKPRIGDMAVPGNPFLDEMHESLQGVILEMQLDVSRVSTFVRLLAPAMSDGANFGLSVNSQVQEEAGYVERVLSGVMQDLCSAKERRALQVTKCLKHPQVPDYQGVLQTSEQLMFLRCKNSLLTVRNALLVLGDTLQKNMQTISDPLFEEGGNASSMMY